jgi:hypothetical protein
MLFWRLGWLISSEVELGRVGHETVETD